MPEKDIMEAHHGALLRILQLNEVFGLKTTFSNHPHWYVHLPEDVHVANL